MKKRPKTTTTRYLTELLDKKIITAGGKTIGHVFDIQLSRDGKNRVTALIYGKSGLLYRLHVFEAASRVFHLQQKPQIIPWDAVDHYDHARVYLKAGYEIE